MNDRQRYFYVSDALSFAFGLDPNQSYYPSTILYSFMVYLKRNKLYSRKSSKQFRTNDALATLLQLESDTEYPLSYYKRLNDHLFTTDHKNEKIGNQV